MTTLQLKFRLPSLTSTDPTERELAGYLLRYTNPSDSLFQPGFKEKVEALVNYLK